MKKLLSTVALIGAVFAAAPAFANTSSSYAYSNAGISFSHNQIATQAYTYTTSNGGGYAAATGYAAGQMVTNNKILSGSSLAGSFAHSAPHSYRR